MGTSRTVASCLSVESASALSGRAEAGSQGL